jgi:peptide/nickel transport system substrate-binding protein
MLKKSRDLIFDKEDQEIMLKGKHFIWLLVSALVVLAMALASCAPTTTTTAPSSAAPTSATKPTAGANWWDKLGEPKYGGTLTVRTASLSSASFDPAVIKGREAFQFEYEPLFARDWALDPKVWDPNAVFVPSEYYAGLLVESWEQTDPGSATLHLRKDARWQNKPPVNGRAVTAADVQYTYDRLLGTGSGFTEVNAFFAGQIPNIKQVVATDQNTAVCYFKKPSAIGLYDLFANVKIVAREWVEQGDLQNWQNAVGTAPWVVTDYTPGTSMTFSKNQVYYGFDERHPQNRLPYIDTFKILEIPDSATTVAALRTQKIDLLSSLSWTDVQNLPQEILTSSTPPYPVNTIDLRCDTKPFTDINVRIALQMAIDTKAIANNVFHVTGDDAGRPCGLIAPIYKGFYYPYDQWSAALKDEYSYNPAKAKQLLADAGYPNGFKTDCYVSNTFSSELIQAVKSYFNDVNVDMTVEVMDQAALAQFLMAGKQDQMSGASWFGQYPPNVYPVRLSKGPQNATFNKDSHYDDLYNQMLDATTIEKAKEVAVAIDKYTLEQHWSVVTSGGRTYQAWQSWVKGLIDAPVINVRNDYVIYPRLWIDDSLKK